MKYKITATGIKQKTDSKELAVSFFERIRDILIENNISDTLTLFKQKGKPVKWVIVTQIKIDKTFFSNSISVGYKYLKQ